MLVENKEMFHFHKDNAYNNIWKQGNVIDNEKNYISDFYKRLLNFCANVETTKGDYEHFSYIIAGYLKEDQDKEMYIRMLKDAKIFLEQYALVQREMVLEQIRKEAFPDLISRKNAIWLCDENQISFWQRNLGNNKLNLFKVSVTGNLFRTSDVYLPDRDMNIIDSIKCAYNYWNPNFKNIDDNKTEYLFQGKLKVLEKCK